MRTLFEAAWLVVLLVLSWTATSAVADAFSRERAAFVTRRASVVESHSDLIVLTLRGGSSKDDDDEDEEDKDEDGSPNLSSPSKDTSIEAVDDDVDDDVEDMDDAEPEMNEVTTTLPANAKPEYDAKLVVAALKSTSKTKDMETSKKLSAVKKAVNLKLVTPSTTTKAAAPARKKSSVTKFLRVPYIVRAVLNPLTLFAMSKAFWASLFNLNYVQDMQPAAGLELRSALEEKAKRTPPPSGGNKGRRKMKRGQAKTISDLPQLSQ